MIIISFNTVSLLSILPQHCPAWFKTVQPVSKGSRRLDILKYITYCPDGFYSVRIVWKLSGKFQILKWNLKNHYPLYLRTFGLWLLRVFFYVARNTFVRFVWERKNPSLIKWTIWFEGVAIYEQVLIRRMLSVRIREWYFQQRSSSFTIPLPSPLIPTSSSLKTPIPQRWQNEKCSHQNLSRLSDEG